MRSSFGLTVPSAIFMGRLYAVLLSFRAAAVIGCGVALLSLIPFVPLLLQAQGAASLSGTIRDSQGKPVAGASVQMRAKNADQTQTVLSDSQGNYSFAALPGGVYTLRAEKSGFGASEIPSLFFGSKEAKHVDLTLSLEQDSRPQSTSAGPPEFFDEPRFTVAGVTDTTSLGGHGSDTIVRTRETLAKETASLGKTSAGGENTAASEAEKTLRQNVEREPRSFEANYRLGKMLVENGVAREAISYLERAREVKPGVYENAYLLAVAYARAGNSARARDDAQALLVHSERAELHHLLGDIQENLGSSLDAVREYQRAAELDPREAYLFDWGAELLLHHAPEPSVEVFTKGARLFPRSVRMLIGLGAAWFARGSYDQAVQRICQASDLNLSDPAPYRFLGKMEKTERVPSDDVVQKLHRFVVQQPENAEANYYYALVLGKTRKEPQDKASAAEIESLLKKAVGLDPRFASAYLQLGILHAEQRDYPRAISDYQQAIHADPRMEEAHYRLAKIYRQVGDAAKAEEELRIYNQDAKESAEVAERERHEIRQFVYTLRDQPPAESQR